MKMPEIKIKKETLVTVGLGVLGIAQLILNGKKEANDKAVLKDEITKQVIENLKNND